jgi:hypothetical protein
MIMWRLGFRVRGMAEQRHGGQPRAGLRLSELQPGQRHLQHAQHEPDAAVREAASDSLQKIKHRLLIGDLLGQAFM